MLITTHVIGDVITASIGVSSLPFGLSFCIIALVTLCTGCGININNSYPTISLNDCINMYNRENNASLEPFSLESLLASTLKHLEDTLTEYENNELDKLLPLYYRYWLHRFGVL